MPCPICKAKTFTKDTRPTTRGTRRRRQCHQCEYTFTTLEHPYDADTGCPPTRTVGNGSLTATALA